MRFLGDVDPAATAAGDDQIQFLMSPYWGVSFWQALSSMAMATLAVVAVVQLARGGKKAA